MTLQNKIISFQDIPRGHTHVLVARYHPMANGRAVSGEQEAQFAFFGNPDASLPTLRSLAQEKLGRDYVQKVRLVELEVSK